MMKETIYPQTETHMRFRPGSILNTPMVIGLMAFALVAFLLLVDTAVMPNESNTNTITVQKRTAPAANNNQNMNSSGTTEGTFLTNDNTNVSDEAGAAE